MTITGKTLTEWFFKDFNDYYNLHKPTWLRDRVLSDLNIPYVYSVNVSSVSSFGTQDTRTEKITLVGYNKNRKQTLSSQWVKHAPADSASDTLSTEFTLYLYDYFRDVDTSNLGLNRGPYIFENQVVLRGNVMINRDGNGYKYGSGNSLSYTVYDLVSGEKAAEVSLSLLPDTSVADISLSCAYNALLGVLDKWSGDETTWDLSFMHNWLNDQRWSVTKYSRVSATTHKKSTKYWAYDSTTGDQLLTSPAPTLAIIDAPMPQLGFISALDARIQYPLGSSPLEIATRALGGAIPYTNRYSTTKTATIGAREIISAVNADVLDSFKQNPAVAGINFSDLSSLYIAVNGYSSVMAADICSAKRVPAEFVPYTQALIDYSLFMGNRTTNLNNAVTRVMGYIKEDFSLNDTAEKLETYYWLYWLYMGYYGSYYTMTDGANVKRLGVAEQTVANLLSFNAQAQEIQLRIACEREKNKLLKNPKLAGSFTMLDKSKTLVPQCKYTAHVGKTALNVICTGYTWTMDNTGKFSYDVTYIQQL